MKIITQPHNQSTNASDGPIKVVSIDDYHTPMIGSKKHYNTFQAMIFTVLEMTHPWLHDLFLFKTTGRSQLVTIPLFSNMGSFISKISASSFPSLRLHGEDEMKIIMHEDNEHTTEDIVATESKMDEEYIHFRDYENVNAKNCGRVYITSSKEVLEKIERTKQRGPDDIPVRKQGHIVVMETSVYRYVDDLLFSIPKPNSLGGIKNNNYVNMIEYRRAFGRKTRINTRLMNENMPSIDSRRVEAMW